MMKRIIVLFLFCCAAHSVSAQVALAQVVGPQPYLPASTVIPVPNSTITYTQIMFDHPPVKDAVMYEIHWSEPAPDGNTWYTSTWDASCAHFADGFKFGTTYTWGYKAEDKTHKIIFESPEYKFTIAPFSGKRLRIITDEKSLHSHGLISFDNLGMITDRNGNPVWVMPSEMHAVRDEVIEDLQVTTAGTILFIKNHEAIEIMPDGRAAWRLSTASSEWLGPYHHCIKRLPNGNIMTIGTDYVAQKIPDSSGFIKVDYGLIEEFNRNSKAVWTWNAYREYFGREEISSLKLPNGKWNLSTGMNAFAYSVQGDSEFVYMSFGNLDRIVKIEKQSKVVKAEYGSKPGSMNTWRSGGNFHFQHDVTVLRDGQVVLFNNNYSEIFPKWESTLLFMSADGNFVKGNYPLILDGVTDGKTTSGGSVEELPNGNLLVNCGSTGRVLEITRDAKVVWDAMAETDESNTGKWVASPLNRSHYVSSLYPCYFTTNISRQTKKRIEVIVWNEGSESDGYTIEYKRDDKWSHSADIVKIEPGGNFTWILGVNKKFQVSQIRVTSRNNPDFVRLINVNKAE